MLSNTTFFSLPRRIAVKGRLIREFVIDNDSIEGAPYEIFRL